MAVLQLLNFLKQNVRSRELFHGVAYDKRVQQIVDGLQKGGAGLQKVIEQGWVAEALAALEYFLVMRLKEPLIPHYVQALALDDNPGVSAEVIAQDILGLLRQDLSGRHETLLSSILDFLNAIIQYTPIDELRGYCVPNGMFPIFFNKPVYHALSSMEEGGHCVFGVNPSSPIIFRDTRGKYVYVLKLKMYF